MRLILAFSRRYPWHTLLMLLALLLSGVAEGISLSAMLPVLTIATQPGLMGSVTGVGPPGEESDLARTVGELLGKVGLTPTIGVLLWIIVVAVLTKSMLMLLAQRQLGYTSARVITDLRLALLRAMLASRWEYFLRHPAGRMMSAMASEADRAAKAYSFGITLIAFLIQAVIYGAIAFLVSWEAALAALGAAVVILALSQFLVRLSKRAGKKQTRLTNQLLARLGDTLQSVKPLKAMAREKLAGILLIGETRKLNKALRRQALATAALGAAQEPLYAGVILVGIYYALVVWKMPVAEMIVLVLVLARMLGTLGKVQRQYQKMVAGESAYWSLRQKIESAEQAREELHDAGAEAQLSNGIELRDVHFSYDTNEVLRGVSLTMQADTLTTLVGPSGAGKTTVIDLVIGLLRPDSGSVLADGVPLTEVNPLHWRQRIGYVPQENLLLHDTIYHNVTLDDPELTQADAERALRDAGAWDFVVVMPQGMMTMVGERGGALSGGQRQRIMIARAVVRKPRLLVLDEATSALDPISERAVCKTLCGLRRGLTILAISHQKAMVEAADRVYRIDNGVAVLEQDRLSGAVSDQPQAPDT